MSTKRFCDACELPIPHGTQHYGYVPLTVEHTFIVNGRQLRIRAIAAWESNVNHPSHLVRNEGDLCVACALIVLRQGQPKEE